ncbi:MAG: DNA methyltransferase [Myxococcota bacterium]
MRYTKDRNGEATFNQPYGELAKSTVKTWGTKKQNAVFRGGKQIKSSTLAEESPGVPMGDVWDISIVAPMSKERLGYLTQNPEALLERVSQVSSDPGQIVVDPFVDAAPLWPWPRTRTKVDRYRHHASSDRTHQIQNGDGFRGEGQVLDCRRASID